MRLSTQLQINLEIRFKFRLNFHPKINNQAFITDTPNFPPGLMVNSLRAIRPFISAGISPSVFSSIKFPQQTLPKLYIFWCAPRSMMVQSVGVQAQNQFQKIYLNSIKTRISCLISLLASLLLYIL
jgi:hypothetical protein